MITLRGEQQAVKVFWTCCKVTKHVSVKLIKYQSGWTNVPASWTADIIGKICDFKYHRCFCLVKINNYLGILYIYK